MPSLCRARRLAVKKRGSESSPLSTPHPRAQSSQKTRTHRGPREASLTSDPALPGPRAKEPPPAPRRPQPAAGPRAPQTPPSRGRSRETPCGPPPPSRGRDRGTPHAPDPALLILRPRPRDPALRRPQPRDPAARPQRPGPRPPEAAAEGPGGPAPRTPDPATRTPPSGDRNRKTPHLRSRARNPALQRLQPTSPRGDAERAALPESDRRCGGGGRSAPPGSSALTPLALASLGAGLSSRTGASATESTEPRRLAEGPAAFPSPHPACAPRPPRTRPAPRLGPPSPRTRRAGLQRARAAASTGDAAGRHRSGVPSPRPGGARADAR
ncbi:proline-rich protein 2-like [Lynx canadensis]|uniref:proline-rich protein 2-like n=1 Tax=Lynx canadensis TaxID=61383 RepID=UPI0011B04B0C|nr:proline-rich protein 2-like [Lynx canadensis]